jgi:hypothetical protein
VTALIDQFHDSSNNRKQVLLAVSSFTIKNFVRDFTDTDYLLQIDFAENCVSNHHSKIQSVHFGRLHQQLTKRIECCMWGSTLCDNRACDPIAVREYVLPIF